MSASRSTWGTSPFLARRSPAPCGAAPDHPSALNAAVRVLPPPPRSGTPAWRRRPLGSSHNHVGTVFAGRCSRLLAGIIRTEGLQEVGMGRYIPRNGPKALWACGLGLWLVGAIGVRVVMTSAASAPPVTVEKTAVEPKVPQPVAQQSAMAAASAPVDVEQCTT